MILISVAAVGWVLTQHDSTFDLQLVLGFASLHPTYVLVLGGGKRNPTYVLAVGWVITQHDPHIRFFAAQFLDLTTKLISRLL
ncbi:hypothetical protein Dacsa_2054 [Dactylococcopsis salina PCC 8305]|uniref:Uncharacterized protein n=1 Tax=Dactylococcopsis salina (strain PCC 8305) TaxID=13035 RepID=K9YUW2_DACS8|nr:hypothetical protein Dacsa_2054 [Dactylococcopsis salina PCC 8305]